MLCGFIIIPKCGLIKEVRGIIYNCKRCNGKVPSNRNSSPYCSKACEISAENRIRLDKERDLVNIVAEVAATTGWAPGALDKVMHVVAPVVGVIGDVHTPCQSGQWLEQAIKTFVHFNAKSIIVNGDLLDCNQISRHAGSYYRRKGELNDDLEAADAVLGLLGKYFDHIYLTQGNHDMRLIHKMGGELSVQRMYKILGTHPKLQITSRSFMRVNDRVLVAHPRAYSKVRGALAQRLAIRHQMSVLTSHEHHSAMSISPCGKYQACAIGCIADIQLQDYVKNELNDFVEPVQGFGVIFNNSIQVFDAFTPWELFGLDNSSLK